MRLLRWSSFCLIATFAATSAAHAQAAPPAAPAAASAPSGTAVPQHEMTTPPSDAIFEIIQSSLIAKLTLRLNRYNGVVDQLVARPDSSIGWQPISRRASLNPDTRVTGRASYQIFTSGITAQFTFLINVNTGATWQLVEDPSVGVFWTPIY